MLNKIKTFQLTQFAVRTCYFLLGAVALTLPFMIKNAIFHFEIFKPAPQYILVPFYAVVPAGYLALVCLDKLLTNIKKEVVFAPQNTKLLKMTSLACFYAGCVGLTSFIVALMNDFLVETLLILSVGEFFMWLIVRVVKNIFDAAIEIKEENDLTI